MSKRVQAKREAPKIPARGWKLPTSQQTARWLILIYGCLALLVAFANRDKNASIFTLPYLFKRADVLQGITNCVQRDSLCIPLSAYCRNVAEQLPQGAKVFMLGMLGAKNGSKLGYYYFMANYLFPREVGISVDRPVSFEGDYYEGRDPTNMDELVSAGYNFAFDFDNENHISVVPLARLSNTPHERTDATCKVSDELMAGMLPLLVAGFGIWLLPALFAFESQELGLGERFACGLALGSLFVSQLFFGFRLMGLASERVLFWGLLLGDITLLVRYFHPIKSAFLLGLKRLASPASLILTPHLMLFVALLWLAGVAGLTEFDAIAGYMLKAKIIYLYGGHEIVQWFSEPRLAHAHLDYPVLVPALHAFTYGVLGRVDEFVTKFWPVWMAFALVVGVLSVCGFPAKNKFIVPLIMLVVLCMPLTMEFMQAEGATIPSVFFTGLGCMECTIGFASSDKKRLWLGMFLLLGAAMTKFEGIIILFLWLAAILSRATTRKLLSYGKRRWVILAFAITLVIPYGALKVQIPQLHPDQLAFRTMLKHPTYVAEHVPGTFGMMMLRQCVDEHFAAWTVSDKNKVVWAGRWIGWHGLINSFNLGWGWLCVALSAALVYQRTTRSVAFVITGVAFAFFFFIAAIYCGLPYLFQDPQRIIDLTGNTLAGRHLAPMLLAWGLSLVVLATSVRPSESQGGRLKFNEIKDGL